MTKKFGIDISNYQKGINMKDAKKEGVEFVIIKAGSSIKKDDSFENFYKECKSLDLPVGAYFYTYAQSVEEAKNDAKKMLSYIKGKSFEYPIVLDIEDNVQKALSKDVNDGIIKAFAEIIEDAGYYFSFYTNKYFYQTYCNGEKLNKKYDVWLAQWASTPYKGNNCGMTQFGGETNFIRSNKIAGKVVDQNYAYYDYPSIMIEKKLNGYGTVENTKKTTQEIADEVIFGIWGNGNDRKENLTRAGYDYNKIQTVVNSKIAETKNNISIKYHIVKKGECLWNIAKKYYNDGSKYTLIKSLNGLNSNNIYAGQKLRVK